MWQVTCNQGHREIKESVIDGDVDGRADIINRYFAKQIDKLLSYIKDGRAFGEGRVYEHLCASRLGSPFFSNGTTRAERAMRRLGALHLYV